MTDNSKPDREEDIQRGERYARSPITGTYYRVTAWVEYGGRKIRAVNKEEVAKEDVPEEWLEKLPAGGPGERYE